MREFKREQVYTLRICLLCLVLLYYGPRKTVLDTCLNTIRRCTRCCRPIFIDLGPFLFDWCFTPQVSTYSRKGMHAFHFGSYGGAQHYDVWEEPEETRRVLLERCVVYTCTMIYKDVFRLCTFSL